ncbi:MAG: tetraacyldisaccharide 4'-kinase [Acidobacteria bacterium]|nr:tetraacyldisaccharide 4'-kinase [Acidobacteriota bacterium]
MIIYFLYRLLGALAFPLILLYLAGRSLRDPRYAQALSERFGRLGLAESATAPGGIWLHAVSAGEVLSAIELLRRLRQRFPSQALYVSVTTVAGKQIAGEKLGGLTDAVFYAPLDYVWIVRSLLRRLRPRLVIVMETEIWPNLYRETKRLGCGLVVVNGRVSDRAFPRYRLLRWFFRRVLAWPDAILAQNKVALERYLALGAPSNRVQAAGNLKYDFRASGLEAPAVIRRLCESAQPDAVWIAASTMPPAVEGDPDEDDAVIAAFQSLAQRHPRLLLMLVPRRPERFEQAARKLEEAGVQHLRRSKLDENARLELPGVLLVDSMGELSSLFPLADVVFMGGTLVDRGGHNILEPAFFARPVIIGPHMENFPDIADEFRASGAVLEIADAGGLAGAVGKLLDDEQTRKRLGERARELAEAKRGATEHAVEVAGKVYSRSLPNWSRKSGWPLLLLWPLARLWQMGVAADRRRKKAASVRLPVPVISIGGIGMGGAGKTPLVGHLARCLDARGHRPVILTRGYGRRTHEKMLLLAPGESCPAARTGDEAQILLRSGHAALAIAADRAEAARDAIGRFQPGVFLMDDGFQHWKLERAIDLVLIDSLDPLAGGDVVPLGRLREPLSALSRATAFVITRADYPVPWTALEALLRRLAPLAPVFYSRMVPVEWVSLDGRNSLRAGELATRSVSAFCGLGNPASFWCTLRQLGIEPRFHWAFSDHESYRPRQLRRLASQAQSTQSGILVTTEKDVMNLPEDAARHLAGIELFWLRTRIEIEQEPQLLAWLLARL